MKKMFLNGKAENEAKRKNWSVEKSYDVLNTMGPSWDTILLSLDLDFKDMSVGKFLVF